MAGGDVNKLALVEARIDHETLLVQGLVYKGGSPALQQHAHPRITRLLDRYRHGRVHQQFTDQVECLLGAHGDQNLVRGCLYAAPWQNFLANLVDQHRVVDIACFAGPLVYITHAQREPVGFTPFLDRVKRLVELSLDKRVGILLPIRWAREGPFSWRATLQPAAPESTLWLRVRGAGLQIDPAFKNLFVDIQAAALPGDQVALIDQLLVGQDHGVASHAELLRQLAGRWQPATDRKSVLENCLDQLLANLGLQVQAAVGV